MISVCSPSVLPTIPFAHAPSRTLRAASPMVGILDSRFASGESLIRGPRACQTDGSPFTRKIVRNRMILAVKRGRLKKGVHILRHTLCSQLSMRGAPAGAIQELAGPRI
jgi:integrase